MQYRLLAIDIDGTLLDSRWRLPPANLAAIIAAVDRGVDVVLATGRRFDGVFQFCPGSGRHRNGP